MRWININKRTPKKGENVFTLDVNKKLYGIGTYLGEQDKIFAAFDFKTIYDDELMNYEVTHWYPYTMPFNLRI